MLNKVCFFFNVLFKDGCFNGILNGIRGFVPQQLQTRGCSWRNDCHQFFPVMKNSSRISTFSILPHCSDKIKYVPLLLSLLLYPYSSMEKRLFKIWKHKLIPRRWGWGGQFGCSPPLSDGLSQNTYGIQPKWHQRDLRGHTQVCHPDSSHLQFKSPKEFVLCSHYKEQLWAYTIKFMIEELTDSRREIEPPEKWGRLFSKSKSKRFNLWTQILESELRVGHLLIPPIYCSCVMSTSPKKGNPKRLPFQVRVILLT